MGFDSNNNSMFSNHAGVRSMQMDSAPSYYNGKELAALAGEEADDEDEMSGGVYTGGSWKSISRSINRGARDLGGDIRRSANATGRDIQRSAYATGRDFERAGNQTANSFDRDLIVPTRKEANRAIKQATKLTNQSIKIAEKEAKILGKEIQAEAKQQARIIQAEAKAQANQALKDLRRSVRPSGAFGQFSSAVIDQLAPAIGQGLGTGIGTLAGNPGLGAAVGERLAGIGRDELKTRTGYGRGRGRTQYSPLPFAIAGGAKPKGKGGGARGALIREVMRKHGVSLPEASRIIKQKGLY